MKLPRELEAKVLAQSGVAKPKAARKRRVVVTGDPARWAVLLYPACRVISEANARGGHWRARAARVKAQRDAVYAAWRRSPLTHGGPEWGHIAGVRVTLTHIGPRMDDDNLATAFKALRDEVAQIIGTDDGDPFYEWACVQRVGDTKGVEIRIEGTR